MHGIGWPSGATRSLSVGSWTGCTGIDGKRLWTKFSPITFWLDPVSGRAFTQIVSTVPGSWKTGVGIGLLSLAIGTRTSSCWVCSED